MKRQFLVSILALLMVSTATHEFMYAGAALEEGAERGAMEGLEAGMEEGAVNSIESGSSKAVSSVTKASGSVAEDSARAAESMMGETHVGESSIFGDGSAAVEHVEPIAPIKMEAPSEAPGATKGMKSIKGSSVSAGEDPMADILGDVKPTVKAEAPVEPVKPTEPSMKEEPSIKTHEESPSKAEEPAVHESSPKEEVGNMKEGEGALNKMEPMEIGEEDLSMKMSEEDAEAFAKGPETNITTEEAAERSYTQMAKDGALSGAKFIGEKVLGVGELLATAVLFMVPSIFESAFLAQQQRNALLTTYAAPIQFGNIVLQIPDSAFNMDDPTQTDFIYYGIPVDTVGATLSAGAASMYPGVHGPSRKNKVSAGINNGMAKMFSMGMSKTTPPPARYNLDASALSSLPIFVSYSDKSWASWGATAIPDPTFDQMLIDLNTGYVFYADGLPDNSPAAALVGTGATQSVQTYLSTKLGKLSTAGSASSYTEYTNTFSSSKASAMASPINDRFNCACISKSKGVLSDDAMKSCNVGGKSTCLIVPALETLSAGVIINADGKQLTKDQDLATEVKKGALGQVIPIQGLGDKFQDYLSFYPGASQDAIANSGVLTISLGFGSESAGGNESVSGSADIKIKGADVDNYAAKGVYVYQCKNTEFAKILKSQAGGSSTTTYNDHINDFIVFLDKELNQMPLMVPAQDPSNYNFPSMQLNPDIMYVSTIIGNTDDQGGFTLLPQLNIPTPEEDVKLGLPASFPPLFGLNAKGGSLSVDYNQTLNSKIGPMAQALESHAELGQQYKDTKAAMLRLMYQGPFGKYSLKPIDVTMQPVISGTNLVMYTGYNAYPVPHDEKSTNCTDVLIPISPQGKTVVLPSNNVGTYYGVVSDLTYTVGHDGSMTVADDGYANSPFSQTIDPKTKEATWLIDDTKTDQYYWLAQLTGMGQGADPSFALPQPLVDFVHARRADWIAWINKTSASGMSNVEFAGVAWAGTKNTLTIVGQQALVNSLYAYTCSPNPSKLSKDYFVLTNSSTPLASDKTLGTMKASSASTKTNMLSMVSGLLYNSSGAQVKNAQGTAYQIDAKDLIQSMYATNPKGFSDDFKTKLNVAYGQYAATENMPVYPFNFYNLKLGMYQADIDRCTYVYFDATGAGTSTNFEPKDYFVTVDLDASPAVWSEQISSSTKYMVSLISGQVYSHTGPQYKLSAEKVAAAIASLSPTWRPGLKDKINALTVAYGEKQTADIAATKKMDEEEQISGAGSLSWKPADVVAIIKAIASQKYLPAPYVMLKQDPSSKQYVQVSPASTNGTDFIYTFFDVPNTYKDAQGKPVNVAAMYDSKGNVLMSFGDLQLESTLIQNGISIDAAGKQSLGVPSLQPIMLLDKADHTLQPGATGKSMICSNHEHFPTIGIKSPITYQGHKFYFYYNTIMKAYYVMEVDGHDVRYVSMAGGNIYNVDGSFRPISNPVAMSTLKDVANPADMLLPYLNNNSYTQCFMKNNANKGLYSDFINVEKSFKHNMKLGSTLAALNLVVAAVDPYNQVNVVQMPRPETIPPMPSINVATQYNVYWDEKNPTVYTVNHDYKSHNLILLPLNMADRSLMNPMPNENFKSARLIMKKGEVDHLLFAGNLYSVAKSEGSIYTMKQVSNATAPTLSVSLNKDAKTGISYYAVAAGQTTYNYQTAFDMLSAEQLTSYRYNAWRAETIADVSAKIILVQFLPRSASGELHLSAVDISKIQGLSNDPASHATMTKNVARVRQDAVDGRFVAKVYKSGGSADQGPFYSYFDQDGYVDLETGALFDEKGVPVGITLDVADLMSLLNKLTVSVMRNIHKQAFLLSRLPNKSGASSQKPSRGKTQTIKTTAGTSSTGKAKAMDFKSKLSQAQIEKIQSAQANMTQAQKDKASKFKARLGQTAEQKQANLKARLNKTSAEKQAGRQSRLNQSQIDALDNAKLSAKSKMSQSQTDALDNAKNQVNQLISDNKSSMNNSQSNQAAAAANVSGILGRLSSSDDASTGDTSLDDSSVGSSSVDASITDDTSEAVVATPVPVVKLSPADQIKKLQGQNTQLQKSIENAHKSIVILSSKTQSDGIKKQIASKQHSILINQNTINQNNLQIKTLAPLVSPMKKVATSPASKVGGATLASTSGMSVPY